MLCNKRNKVVKLLKTAYIIIYSRLRLLRCFACYAAPPFGLWWIRQSRQTTKGRKYLLEFDTKFITDIKNRYVENAVLLNKKVELMTNKKKKRLHNMSIRFNKIK
jgi:hypothetical protein